MIKFFSILIIFNFINFVHAIDLNKKEKEIKQYLISKKLDLQHLLLDPAKRSNFENEEVMKFAFEGKLIHDKVSIFLKENILNNLNKNNKRVDDKSSNEFNLRINALGMIYSAAGTSETTDILCDEYFNEYISQKYISKAKIESLKERINDLSEEFFNYRWRIHKTEFNIPEEIAADKIITMIKYIDLYLNYYLI